MMVARPGEYIARWRGPSKAGEPLGCGFSKLDAGQARALENDPDLTLLEPNYCFHRLEDASEPGQGLWGLEKIGAPAAWAAGNRGQGVTVAVLDTGADLEHPELSLWTNPGEVPGDGLDNDGNGIIDDVHGYNAAEQTGNPGSDDAHGTHVAGTIAGRVTGVAPEARVVPIRIYDEDDWTDSATLIRALTYAAAAGASVTCNSYSGLMASQAVKEAFANAPMLHVFAAGNYHSDNDAKPTYPANYELANSLVVAASDRHDQLADFSNYGRQSVDLAAPGVDVYSTTPYGNHGTWSGTSMAAPHVAGAAALLAGKFSQESPVQWRDRLLGAVIPQPGWQEKMASGGRLDLEGAIRPSSDDATGPPAGADPDRNCRGPESHPSPSVADRRSPNAN